MNLLLDEVDVLETTGDTSAVDVRGVEHDSRRVSPGDLFCCLPGGESDGHRFAPDAAARGAVGLLCEHFVTDRRMGPLPQAMVAPGTARPAMARLAAALYGHPSRHLLMVGVTGTNGKTTVTDLLGSILEHAGRAVSVVGTLTGVRTTPEAPELQRLLADARDRAGRQTRPGRPTVAMEVSSHALVQSRVDGVHYDVAVFTNLSHDHLDFHGSMEAYFSAKASLFTPERAVEGVVSADDPWGRRLLAAARIPLRPVSRGDLSDLVLSPGRSTFRWRQQVVTSQLSGLFNVDNALLAAETALCLGLGVAEVAAGLSAAPPVPGRLEFVTSPDGDPGAVAVLVDYAHTPAALEVVLGEARRLGPPGGSVRVVFGAGGDRDREKRPLMGEVAARLADVAYLTSDNPRHEEPGSIIEDVRAGVAAGSGATLVVEPDRRAAIERALHEAGPGDVVVLAGKGHETYQEVAGTRTPFDDRAVAREVLANRPSGRR